MNHLPLPPHPLPQTPDWLTPRAPKPGMIRQANGRVIITGDELAPCDDRCALRLRQAVLRLRILADALHKDRDQRQ